ncbi:MAG: C1 family peptidase [Rhodospirillales bacterium]
MAESTFSLREVSAAIAREGLDWQAGENQLTAMADEERRRFLGVVVTPEERARLAAECRSMAAVEQQTFATRFAAPASFDWRNVSGANYVTEVKNQGSCGSCVSFCSCAVIESAIRIKLGNPSYAVDLSEAFMQFCGGGSCSGWGLTSGLAFAKSTGVTDEACMPYQPQNMNCQASRCSDWQNRLTKIKDYAAHSTMEARKNAIATKGPVLAGMAVYTDFYGYSSGIYQKTSTATLEGYHCIAVVGYNDAQQYWIIKNSWGKGWGQSGFCFLRYGQNDILIDTEWAFYTVEVEIAKAWHSNVTVTQVYATPHSKNAWAHLQGLGWRKIEPVSNDGVTNTLALLTYARAHGRKVSVYADGDQIYQAYML